LGKANNISPFHVIYGYNPRPLLDVVLIPTPTKFSWEVETTAKQIQGNEKFNDLVRSQPNRCERNVHSKSRGLVHIHLWKKRFV